MTSSDLQEVEVQAVALDRLAQLLGPERAEQFTQTAEPRASAAERTAGRQRELDRDRWRRRRAPADAARVRQGRGRRRSLGRHRGRRPASSRSRSASTIISTAPTGDGGPLGAGERRHYEDDRRRNAAGLDAVVRAGDIVILHDPQTAGLARHLAAAGCQRRVALPRRHRHAERTLGTRRGRSCARTSRASTPTCSPARSSRRRGCRAIASR